MSTASGFEETYNQLDESFQRKFHSEPQKLISGLVLALEQFGAEKDKPRVLEIQKKLALCHHQTGAHEKAINLLEDALVRSQNLALNYLTADILNCLGAVYLKQNKFEKALDLFIKGLEFNVPAINKRIYNNLGQAYKANGKLDQALLFFNKSSNLEHNGASVPARPFSLISLGDIYLEKGKYEQALVQYKAALDLSIEQNKGAYLPVIYANMGTACKKQNKLHEAKKHFESGLSASIRYTNPQLQLFNALQLAEYHFVKANTDQALIFGNQAISLAEDLNQVEEQIKAIEILEQISASNQEYEKAYEYARKLNKIQLLQFHQEGNQVSDDLLKRKEAQISLLESRNKVITEKNAELQQIAHIIAHDLKAPLRSISGFSTLIKKKYYGKLEGEFDEFFDFIINGAIEMHELLTDLLEYVSVEKTLLEKEMKSTEEIVYKVLQKLNHIILDSNTEVIVDELPRIYVYPQFLAQIFQNLIHNGIKFRKPTHSKIRISCREYDHEYRFSVSDEGVGIKPEYQQRIFSLFTQLDQTREGTGIGLAICKKMAQIHGGELWVESEPGKGSTFFFTIAKPPIIIEQVP